jgi:hypothetical protein
MTGQWWWSVVVVFGHGGVALHREHKRGSTLSCFCAKWSPKSTSSQPAQETPSSTSLHTATLICGEPNNGAGALLPLPFRTRHARSMPERSSGASFQTPTARPLGPPRLQLQHDGVVCMLIIFIYVLYIPWADSVCGACVLAYVKLKLHRTAVE